MLTVAGNFKKIKINTGRERVKTRCKQGLRTPQTTSGQTNLECPPKVWQANIQTLSWHVVLFSGLWAWFLHCLNPQSFSYQLRSLTWQLYPREFEGWGRVISDDSEQSDSAEWKPVLLKINAIRGACCGAHVFTTPQRRQKRRSDASWDACVHSISQCLSTAAALILQIPPKVYVLAPSPLYVRKSQTRFAT